MSRTRKPDAARVRNARTNERARIRSMARRRGYGRNADAFVAGYERDRAYPGLRYPGPERVAHNAGWIEAQQADAETDAARWDAYASATHAGQFGTWEADRSADLGTVAL